MVGEMEGGDNGTGKEEEARGGSGRLQGNDNNAIVV